MSAVPVVPRRSGEVEAICKKEKVSASKSLGCYWVYNPSVHFVDEISSYMVYSLSS